MHGVPSTAAATDCAGASQTKVELVVDEIRAAGPYGIVCCDANVDAVDALPLVGPALPLLATGGILVLTVKCPTKYVTRESLQQLERFVGGALKLHGTAAAASRDRALLQKIEQITAWHRSVSEQPSARSIAAHLLHVVDGAPVAPALLNKGGLSMAVAASASSAPRLQAAVGRWPGGGSARLPRR